MGGGGKMGWGMGVKKASVILSTVKNIYLTTKNDDRESRRRDQVVHTYT